MNLTTSIILTVCVYASASGCRKYLPKTAPRAWLVPLLYALAWSAALMALSRSFRLGRLSAIILAITSGTIGAAFLFGWLLPGKVLKGGALHACRGSLVAAIGGPLLAMRFDQVYSLPSRLDRLSATTLGEVGAFVCYGLPGFITVGLGVFLVSMAIDSRRHGGRDWGRAAIPAVVGLVCWLLFFANWYVAGLYDIYKATERGNTTLLRYVSYSRPGVLRAREYDGSSATHYLRDSGTVTFLAGAGVDIDARILHGGDSGRTALHMAANAGNVDVVRALLQHGAEIDVRDPAHWTPLGRALHENQMVTAVFLIGSGAKVDSLDRAGNTPLHWAAVQGNQKAVALLVSAGATVNPLNSHGRTPLDVASSKSTEIKALLKSLGGLTSVEVAQAAGLEINSRH